jgi:hypothetical protein
MKKKIVHIPKRPKHPIKIDSIVTIYFLLKYLFSFFLENKNNHKIEKSVKIK